MRILVTGANGQLGNEMRDLAVKYAQHTYFFTDVQELDICDAQAVQAFVAENGIELIVNCAAYTAVDKAEDNADLCDRLNHLAPAGLADAAERVGAALIHVSTDYVFDGTAHVPYTEEVAPCPNSVYGRTKLAGEGEVVLKCPGAMIIRTAWLYSSYGGNFVKTMLRLAKERDEIGVVADQIGTPTYARDLARAICTIAEQGIVPGIYHFTNEGAASWYDFTKTIFRLEGYKHLLCLYPRSRQDGKSQRHQSQGFTNSVFHDKLKICVRALQLRLFSKSQSLCKLYRSSSALRLPP